MADTTQLPLIQGPTGDARTPARSGPDTILPDTRWSERLSYLRTAVLLHPMTTRGFWDHLPIEEQRIPLPTMEPMRDRRERYVERKLLSWLDLSELTVFLCIFYLAIGITRIGIILMDWSG